MKFSNLTSTELIERSLALNEGKLKNTGALLVTTGNRTGRSPNDRFIVDELTTSNLIDWGDVNRPFSEEKFNELWDRVSNHLSKTDYFVSTFASSKNRSDHCFSRLLGWRCARPSE